MKKNSKHRKLSMLKRVCADLGRKKRTNRIIPPGADSEADYWEYVRDPQPVVSTVTTVLELMPATGANRAKP